MKNLLLNTFSPKFHWCHWCYLELYVPQVHTLVVQMVKHLPTIWETWVQSLGQKDPLEKEIATHSSTLAWKIPWTEEPGRLQSMGSQRVRHDWATSLSHNLTSPFTLSASLLSSDLLSSSPPQFPVIDCFPSHWENRNNQKNSSPRYSPYVPT